MSEQDCTITVYTKPACVQGNATYKALDKQGLEYRCIDITVTPGTRDYVMSLGYLQAPVVYVQYAPHLDLPDEHFSGFRPERIKTIRFQVAAAAAA